MMHPVLEEVTRTSIELLLKEPFYSHFFSALNKEITPRDGVTATMSVSLRQKTVTLTINEYFWKEVLTSKQHRYGVIKHEVLHLVFRHLLVNEPGLDHRLKNIAMDIVVNQFIDRTLLPEESVFMDLFPELNLDADQTWMYYYKKLEQLQLDIQSQTGLYASVSAQNLMNLGMDSYGLDRHGLWAEVYEQSLVEKEVIAAKLEGLVIVAHTKTGIKQFGKLPAALQLLINAILIKEKPLVNWRRVLKLFTESSRKTRIKNTLKRPSRRYGTTPGIKVKHEQKLLVALDTSGSISMKEYEDFFSEIHHIWRRGTVIEIVECDSKIRHVFTYKGRVPERVHGGGGTDFNPPILYANETSLPDALIYFTDGVAPAPVLVPKIPVLWVISRDGIHPGHEHFKQLKGRKAKLN